MPTPRGSCRGRRGSGRFADPLEAVEDQVGGNRSLSAMRRALTPDGTVVMVAPSPGQWIGPVARMIGAVVTSRFARQKVRPLLSTVSRDDLLVLKDLIEAGKVRPVIDRTYPFNEIPDAVRYVEAGRARGKVVISVMDPG